MSGFEVAGVVLGSLPLVISAIEHYATLVQTIKRSIKYEIELKSLKHDLDAESLIFLDTLERVLDGLIPASQLEEQLNDPASPLWQDDSLNERLRGRLGRSYSVFTDTVKDMNATIQEIIQRLDLDGQGKVRWTERTGLKLALKRAGFSLRKRDFDNLIDRLRKHNRYLEKFTNRSIELEPLRKKRKQSSTLQKLAGHAKSAFHALEASFGCDCRGADSHTLLLGLAPQPPQLPSQSSKWQDKVGLQVVISGIYPRQLASLDKSIIWQEMSLEPTKDDSKNYAQHQIIQDYTQPPLHFQTASTKPDIPTRRSVRFFQVRQSQSSTLSQSSSQTTVTQIMNTTTTSIQPSMPIPPPQPSFVHIPSMCKIISASPSSSQTNCLGYIADGDRKFLLYPLACSFDPDSSCWSTISLRHILQDTVASTPPLTFWDRLTLAATVASAVLQLHASPWLNSAWNNNDVLFLQREGEQLYKQAFVARKIPHSSKTAVNSPNISIFNDTLLSLAIVLVELSLGPLETLQTPDDLQAGVYANMVTLWRLVENDRIGIVFGPKYQAAVKRCIELAKASTSLDEQIQQDVYEGVVSVLEDQAMRKNSAPR